MRSKKGTWVGFVLHPTFETAVALVLVLSFLLWLIHGIGDTVTFQKDFFAVDVPLTIEAVLAMPQPGNLYALYHPQKSPDFRTDYQFNVRKTAVQIKAGDDDRRPVTGYFTADPSIVIEESSLRSTEGLVVPIFIRQGNRMSVENVNERTFTYNRNVLACSGPRFAGKLRVQPVNAEAQTLAAVLGSRLWAVKSGGEGVLGVRIAEGSPSVVKAFINAEQEDAQLAQSWRLGCEIVNAVLAYLDRHGVEVDGAAVVPVNPSHTARPDDNLLQGKGVLLDVIVPSGGDSAAQQAFALAASAGVENALS